MSVLFVYLVALCGHDDYRTRDAAEAWLRFARPDSEQELVIGLLGPNPEVTFRCHRALAGFAPRTWYRVGYRLIWDGMPAEVVSFSQTKDNPFPYTVRINGLVTVEVSVRDIEEMRRRYRHYPLVIQNP